MAYIDEVEVGGSVYQLLASEVYEGVDLTAKFASEVGSDPWAWIKGRIQAGDYSGIHVGDYIPFTADGNTYHAEVAGINTYRGNVSTDHIDFICRELWPETHQMNTPKINNGTKFGDAAATEYPWLASDLYLWLNAKAGNVASSATAGGGDPTPVDYTETGVYVQLPSALKAVITEKRMYLPKRYSASGLLTDDNGAAYMNVGNLWVPTEFEIYGSPCWGGAGYTIMGNNVQYPLFRRMRNRIRLRSGSAYSWWTMTTHSGTSKSWCLVSSDGRANHADYASYVTVAAPICFRIM